MDKFTFGYFRSFNLKHIPKYPDPHSELDSWHGRQSTSILLSHIWIFNPFVANAVNLHVSRDALVKVNVVYGSFGYF